MHNACSVYLQFFAAGSWLADTTRLGVALVSHKHGAGLSHDCSSMHTAVAFSSTVLRQYMFLAPLLCA